MANPVALAEAVTTALGTVTGISVFDGNVPNKVPETADGYILPYAVLWAGNGDNPDEVPADGKQATDVLIWDFQVTVVASNPAAVRAVMHSVRLALINLPVGTGRIRMNPDGFSRQAPIQIPEVTPVRFMLPLQLRLITN